MSTSTTHPTPQLERPTLEHGVPGSALARHPALVLSHRSWSHAVREELARPGRYLALDAGTTSLLLGLERDVTHIGRGLSADIQLEDQRVSRQHAIVLRRGASFVIVDDRSACGTFVNGDRVSEAELHDGDEIVLGPVRLRFVEIARRPVWRARPQISRRRALARAVARF